MVTNIVDISDGTEFEIVGTPLDIDRVQQACKRKMKVLEEDVTMLPDKITVNVPRRDGV